MATLKVVIFFFNFLLAYAALGKEVQLSSNFPEQNAGQITVCVDEPVTFECTGNDLQYMRWVMEPFVSRQNPVTFIYTDNEGCLTSGYDQLKFCLIYKSQSPDSVRANMTSTLTFMAAEKISGMSLNGTVVMCNKKTITLQVIKDPLPPPPLNGLDCSISGDSSFCSYNFTFRVVCNWTPLPVHQISGYKFKMTSIMYGQLSPLTVAANESSLEFIIMCLDRVEIDVFGLNKCNVFGEASSKHIAANCSECMQNRGECMQNRGAIALAAVLSAILGMALGAIGAWCYSRGIILSYFLVKPSNIKVIWTKCRADHDLPVNMSHMHIVKIGDKLFCGGGYTGEDGTANKVFTCTCIDSRPEEWTELPGRCPVEKFALTHYTFGDSVKLFTVGGQKHSKPSSDKSILSDKVYLYSINSSNESTKWEEGSLLEVPRIYPTALNYKPDIKEYIIACGGIPDVRDTDVYHSDDPYTYPSTDIAQIYDGESWQHLDFLPFKRNSQSLANIGQNFYIVGGGAQKKVSNDAAMITYYNKNSKWKRMQPCPLAGSTAIGIKGELLVIGGLKTVKWPWSTLINSEAKQSIYVFNKNGKWEEVQVNGNAPRVYMAAVKKLSDDEDCEEFILIGGQYANNKPEASVYIGTVKTA